MKRLAAAVIVLAVAACTRDEPAAKAPEPNASKRQAHPIGEKPPDDSADRASIMSMARGSTVISRTGEALLEASAVRAIDGDPSSYWLSPPHDLPQSMTVALAARSRIDKVGFRTDAGLPVKTVRFERSLDGAAYTEVASVKSAQTIDAQWFDVTPAEATHIRVTMVDSPVALQDARLRSVTVRGTEVEPPRPGDAAGCWSVNGSAASLERAGNRVFGTLHAGDTPLQLDGGFDGRTYRLHWIRGNDYGYAMFTVSPDSKHLSGLEWHEEAIPMFFGDSWFGDRVPCGARERFDRDMPVKFFRRSGHFSLFSLRFRDDGSLDERENAATLQWLARVLPSISVRVVAHEFRRSSAAENRSFAQRELDALRDALRRAGAKIENIEFVAQGSAAARQEPVTEPMRAIYSTVDLEIRR